MITPNSDKLSAVARRRLVALYTFAIVALFLAVLIDSGSTGVILTVTVAMVIPFLLGVGFLKLVLRVAGRFSSSKAAGR